MGKDIEIKRPILDDYQKETLKNFFIISIIVVLGSLAIYGLYRVARNFYEANATERTVVEEWSTRETHPITDKQHDRTPRYRRDDDGHRHIVGYDDYYYIFYTDINGNRQKKRIHDGWSSKSTYSNATAVIAEYLYEKVYYTAKFPDKYKGDKELNKEYIEISQISADIVTYSID